jgi:hypothetical protein
LFLLARKKPKNIKELHDNENCCPLGTKFATNQYYRDGKDRKFLSQALELIQQEIKCLRNMERRILLQLAVLNTFLEILIHSSGDGGL